MGASKALAALFLVSIVGSSFSLPLFHQDFSGSGWKSQFLKSTDSRYNGDLVAETPEGWTQPGLKARLIEPLCSSTQALIF